MKEKILSISEITEIERAYSLGVPSLGIAAEKLIARWVNELRDEETAIRLIFLRWYSKTEPQHLTGLADSETKIPPIETIIQQFGGEPRLSAECMFAIAILSFDGYAFGMGDETIWQSKARQYFIRAAETEPRSVLFTDWKFLIGEADDSRNLKATIEAEIHARFHARGYMGTYLEHILGGMVRFTR